MVKSSSGSAHAVSLSTAKHSLFTERKSNKVMIKDLLLNLLITFQLLLVRFKEERYLGRLVEGAKSEIY